MGSLSRWVLTEALSDRNGSPIGSPWQTYRLLIGNPIDLHSFDGKIWADVFDFTEDFDREVIYQVWSASRSKRWMCQQPVSLGDYDRPVGVGPVE